MHRAERSFRQGVSGLQNNWGVGWGRNPAMISLWNPYKGQYTGPQRRPGVAGSAWYKANRANPYAYRQAPTATRQPMQGRFSQRMMGATGENFGRGVDWRDNPHFSARMRDQTLDAYRANVRATQGSTRARADLDRNIEAVRAGKADPRTNQMWESQGSRAGHAQARKAPRYQRSQDGVSMQVQRVNDAMASRKAQMARQGGAYINRVTGGFM